MQTLLLTLILIVVSFDFVSTELRVRKHAIFQKPLAQHGGEQTCATCTLKVNRYHINNEGHVMCANCLAEGKYV